jgi:carboxyl-terminal processing protease
MGQRTALGLGGAALVMLGVLVGWGLDATLSTGPKERPALQRVEEAYQIARKHYAEPVDAQKLAQSGVKGYLKTLDPHSVYIPPQRMQQIRESFRASFEGIGVSYSLVGPAEGPDTIYVETVVPGGPSDRAGLRAGDRIVAVAGSSAVGFSHDKVQRALKGPGGTTVEVTVRRPRRAAPMEVSITRGKVPLRTVDVAYMVDDSTGYVKLNRFARTTYREFKTALDSLTQEGMTRLMLDLRGNTGGYLEMAVRLCDEFLVDGQSIVTARSRHASYSASHNATETGAWQERPVMILVDEHSASASEIVAGAVQDHDRGLIVGSRTFGKGLVQKQFDLGGESALRLTVARFYTPSGRLIQTPYDGGREAYYEAKRQRIMGDGSSGGAAADSLSNPPSRVAAAPESLRYRTDAGRVVVGGGGILPDRVIRAEAQGEERLPVAPQAVRTFMRHWMDRHGDALRRTWDGRRSAFLQDYAVGDSTVQALLRSAQGEGTLAPHASGEPGGDYRTLRLRMKSHVARRLFGSEAWYPVYHRTDPVLQAAMREWGSARRLATAYPVRTPDQTTAMATPDR